MLSAEQRQFYEENGYLYPLRVFSDDETAEFRRHFDDYTEQNQDRLSKLIPRERRAVYGLTHLMLPWVYEIASHPRVLDAVEGAIGPNILVWGSDWFVKFPARCRLYLLAPGRSILGFAATQSHHRVDCTFSQHARERMHAGDAGHTEDAVPATRNVRVG